MKQDLSTSSALSRFALTAFLLFACLPAFAEDAVDPSTSDPHKVLERYDTNGDGKLSVEEQRAARDAWHTQALKEFDADGDGKLSDQERKQAMNARRLKIFDRNGDGKIDEAEESAGKAMLKARQKEYLAKYDANSDGHLDRSEREKARADGVILGRPRGHGAPGRGPARASAPAPAPGKDAN